MMLSHSNSK